MNTPELRRSLRATALLALLALPISPIVPALALAQAPSYLLQWGTRGSGDGQFSGPAGMAVDAGGNVYVADYGNHRVQKFTLGGGYLTQWGTHGSGDAQFNGPEGVAVDASGNVYVTDTGNGATHNDRIQKFTDTGVYVRNGVRRAPATGSSTGRGEWP